MVNFSDNPDYKLAFESKVHGKKFYVPTNLSNYHISRQMAANAQNIYASSGATKDVLKYLVTKMLDIANDEKDLGMVRTDIGTLCNNILYRLQYPVDEDCGLRLGATYTFIEGEDPNIYSLAFTQQKELLARGDVRTGVQPDPDLYAFFLSMGIASMESYQDLSEDLKDMEYLVQREKILRSLTPQSLLGQELTK
ncbi:MAG TPA: hypothetical protein VFQ86_05900 [Arachidicoccus soli]|nr:hypothetical protein [Arachidicoccus soli]